VNPAEVAELVDLISTYSPGAIPDNPQRLRALSAVWGTALADVALDHATAAVHEHFASSGPWISVADIRTRVAERLGVMPPDLETAYGQARRFREWLHNRRGVEPTIHPAAIAAARTIGWVAFDGFEGDAHKRFAEAYGTTRQAAFRELVELGLDEARRRIAAPKALPGGTGVTRPPDPPADPVGLVRIGALTDRGVKALGIRRAGGDTAGG
jgi:hypothetical protein